MSKTSKTPRRIGIFSGSFDPVHKGHVTFALHALKVAHLDMVYFAPEVKPRRKPQVSHIAHRIAMLELAVRAHPRLGVLDLPGKYFLPKTTMGHLQKRFPKDTLAVLLGADLFDHLAQFPDQWPHVEYMLQQVEIIVAEREGVSSEVIAQQAQHLPVQPLALWHTTNTQPLISSTKIRASMIAGEHPQGLLKSVETYARKQWLYHDIESANKKA